MDTKNYYIIGLSVLAILAVIFAAVTYDTRVSLDTAQEAVDDAVQLAVGDNQQENDEQISSLNSQLTELQAQLDGFNAEIAEKESELAAALAESTADQELIESLQEQLAELDTEVSEVESEIQYLEDELALASSFAVTLTDNKLSTLFDGEVDFDGDDYDAEETFTFGGLVKINGNDFAENAYFVVDDGDLVYSFIFESTLNTSLISSDEPLEFSFLGTDVSINSWSSDSITFTSGDDYIINHGESLTIGEQVITLVIAGEDYAYVDVDGETEKIDEDDTEEVNGLEIYVEFTLEGELASLTIANDVESTVDDGDEYAEDSIWEWSISGNTIGLTLAQDFSSIDDDEDYKALDAGDEISLPNDYITVRYNGIGAQDNSGYEFELEDGFVEAKGNFLFGLNDYDLVYINASGFFDEDEELIVNASGALELEDTELTLNLSGTDMVLDDITIPLALTGVVVDGTSLASKDDNYRTIYGIVVESPEDYIEDNEVSLIVCEDALETSVTVY